MSKILISIIVPIYNAEKYLLSCVDSIRRQSYDNLEILLINDGSKDSSLSICHRLADLDARIVVIDKSNEGVSCTRNLGATRAKGEYIMFVDADDIVDEQIVEKLLKSLTAPTETDKIETTKTDKIETTETDAAVAMCKISALGLNGQLHPIYEKNLIATSFYGDRFGRFIQHFFVAPSTNKDNPNIMGSCARMLIKRSVLIENGIRFPNDVKQMEDLLFCVKLFSCIKRVSVVDEHLYQYRYNPLSSSNAIVDLSAIEDRFRYLNKLDELLVDLSISKERKDEIRGFSDARALIFGVTNYMRSSLSYFEKLHCIKKFRQDSHIKNGAKFSISAFDKKAKIVMKLIKLKCYFAIFCYYKLKN